MLQAKKLVHMLVPTSTTNAATATGYMDTKGYDYADVVVVQATSNDTTNNLSVCKLAESDTTNATDYSDVTAFVGDGTGGFTIPAADTSAHQLYLMRMDLRARKRYIKISMSPLTTQILEAIGVLSKGEQSPESATNAGVAVLVEG